MVKAASDDRRVARTRAAVAQAFIDLVGERAYDEIGVGDIIERADVGRSTFYQHYSNKDDVLRAVMEGGFQALADAVSGGERTVHLEPWLGIFHDNRRGGRALLSGTTRAFISRELAALIEARLERIAALAPRRAPVALKLVAAMIAEGQLGLINAWLSGQGAANAADVAVTLRLSAQAQIEKLFRSA